MPTLHKWTSRADRTNFTVTWIKNLFLRKFISPRVRSVTVLSTANIMYVWAAWTNKKHWWNNSDSGKLKSSEKTCPGTCLYRKIPHGLAWECIPACMVTYCCLTPHPWHGPQPTRCQKHYSHNIITVPATPPHHAPGWATSFCNHELCLTVCVAHRRIQLWVGMMQHSNRASVWSSLPWPVTHGIFNLQLHWHGLNVPADFTTLEHVTSGKVLTSLVVLQ
jgi:hypothetical protein